MLQLSERTLGDWLEHWAEVTPDKEYIVYSDRNLRFTWKQFNERVDHMAKGLLAIGVKKDTHVGIWARNVPDWLTFLYACAKIGAVAVTVNTNYKQAGAGIPLRKLRHAYSVYRRRREGQQLRGNDLHHAARTEALRTGPHEEQALPSHAQCGVHRSGEIPGYV